MGMKPLLIFVTKDRPYAFRKSFTHNLVNAGCETDILIIDNGSTEPLTKQLIAGFVENFHAQSIDLGNNTGLGNAMNLGMKIAFDNGYRLIQFCFNDIYESQNWLADKISCANDYPDAGVIATAKGLWSDSSRTTPVVGEARAVSGQPLITRQVISAIGFFNAYGGLHGPILQDYAYRTAAAGFKNIILPGSFYTSLPPHDDLDTYGFDLSEHKMYTLGEHKENLALYQAGRQLYRPFTIDDRRLNASAPFKTTAARYS
jgi:hypothetical protein